MKVYLLMLLSLLSAYTLSAQLVITPGGQFAVSGNLQLTLQNSGLVNNGSFSAGTGMISFTGDSSMSISGSQPLEFNQVEMNKTHKGSVRLQEAIGVSQRILFTSGFLDLNGFNTDLGAGGHLEGEKEDSRILGANGGEVRLTVALNAPANSNPGNLGAVITSSQNLGNVTIKRGHQSQASGLGTGATLLRYYDISPDNNTNLNATLRINYFDGELNGFGENSLVLLENQNINSWASLGFTLRDTIANFVEKPGISTFGRFTLSSIGNALPGRFSSFNVQCDIKKVALSWKTAGETNSSFFIIERSPDSTRWVVIGSQPATGNSANERSYSFADNHPVQNGYYRIGLYDFNGNVQYSITLRASCSLTNVFSMWPNPFHDNLFINIVSDNQSEARIRIFDSKGLLVKMQEVAVSPGSNQLSVDTKSLANGVYLLSVDWNNGQTQKRMEILKL